MRLNWSAEEVLRAVRGQSLHGQDWTAHGVSIDSRTIQTGDLFIALKDNQKDGHASVHEAIQKGATAAIVSRQPPQVPPDAPLIFVDDTAQALHDLAAVGRARTQARIVAIAGSVGKSGLRDMLRLMLGTLDDTYAAQDEAEARWSTSLALARLPAQARFAVIDINARGAETARLAREVAPHIGILAPLDASHLVHFESMEALVDDRAGLFQAISASGVAILPRDTPHFARLLAATRTQGIKKILSYGNEAKADARLISCKPDLTGSQTDCTIRGVNLGFRIGASGEQMAVNAAAALLACEALGAEITICAETLAFYRPPATYGQRHILPFAGGTITLIDESLQTGPLAVQSALKLLAQTPVGPAGHRIAILGDMPDLGKTGAAQHAALVQSLVENGIDTVHCCGQLMAHLHDVLPGAMRGLLKTDSSEIASLIAAEIHAGDAVLVKGAQTMHMEKVVQALQSPFCENRLAG